jgi:hypothetical protein
LQRTPRSNAENGSFVEFGDDVEVFIASSSSGTVSRKGLEGGNRSKDAHARTASRRTNGDAVTVRSDRSVSMEPHGLSHPYESACGLTEFEMVSIRPL